MGITLKSEVRFLRGVGEQRMKKYQKLGISTVEDLLRHVPREYIDLRNPLPIGRTTLGERQAVRGILGNKGTEHRLRQGLTIQKLLGVDRKSVV